MPNFLIALKFLIIFGEQLLLKDRVRGLHESDAHVAVNQRGEALFERPEHFKTVLTAMLRRAIANLADTDADIAHRLSAVQGEYDISSMLSKIVFEYIFVYVYLFFS